MKLRNWQIECIGLALQKYKSGLKHFLALATPGAGKTIMASALAKQMLENKLCDLVMCFSPSSVVCVDFSKALEEVIGEKFDGLMGSKGQSLTYLSMQYLDSDFWRIFKKYRVFVIFDEIHHCSGSSVENANAWGEQIILNVQRSAKFTIALTGTPWRSDASPIVLATYSDITDKVQCDYVYGLADAIKDKVCRIPKVIAIDNDNISLQEHDGEKSFNSFKELLTQSVFPYLEIIYNETLIIHLIEQANQKLNLLRKSSPSAGGLIVATSVDHAHLISKLLIEQFDEKATIVTYLEDEPTKIIHSYRYSCSKWVISVGMISEGTNIPRLQVCCHLTNIKTEMHFRQILGRILRMTNEPNQEAILYMPAEPKLIEYAYRISQDVPVEAGVVHFEKISANFKAIKSTKLENKKKQSSHHKTSLELLTLPNSYKTNALDDDKDNLLSATYESMVNIFGKYKQEALDIELKLLG